MFITYNLLIKHLKNAEYYYIQCFFEELLKCTAIIKQFFLTAFSRYFIINSSKQRLMNWIDGHSEKPAYWGYFGTNIIRKELTTPF
jgi:hypothetical protein